MYFRMMPFFCIHISQGSVAIRLGYGGVIVYDFVINFLLSVTVKKVCKIGQYLVKLWPRVRCLVFFDSSVVPHSGWTRSPTDRSLIQQYQSVIDQSCSFGEVHVLKLLSDPLEVGNILPGINDNVRERGLEQKCFHTLTEGRQRRGRDHIVRHAVPDGASGDWEGPATDVSQFHGRYQQTIGPSRAEGTSTRQIGDTNQLTEV